MPFSLADYFQKQGLRVIEAALKAVDGKPASYLRDDDHYRMYVVQPAWNALPVSIRLLMKRQVACWEELLFGLRDEVFDLDGKSVAIRPNGFKRVASQVRRAFGDAQATTPLAEPVATPREPAADTAVPLAQPVTPLPAAANVGPAVGIDLGTTYSVVAYVDAQGRPCSLLNADGERLTPSVVLFGDDGTIVGKQALLGSALEPDRTAICVKRDMGAKFYRRTINGEHLPPEVISSFILRSLKADAERQLGPVTRAVITVPAYFDEMRRRATVDAGRLAGLAVLDIINEPTAAAIAYGHQLGYLDRAGKLVGAKPLRALVFDLGGGTFDVTIVEIGPGSFKALATDGDVGLGGKDWDEQLVALVAERLRGQQREDPRENPNTAQELQLAAEGAKRTLTERSRAILYLNYLGQRRKIEVTRDEFEHVTLPLLERTRMTTEIVVRQAGLTFADLDRILLVGGATRMPMVARMLEELAGKKPDRSISADEAVAHGAALYAAVLAPTGPAETAPQFEVTNVNSHSLGILATEPASGKKFNKVLIPKNTPLPFTRKKKFQTYKTGQRAVLIKILEGESDRPGFCTPIGVCTIAALPPDLPAGAPIEVSYTYQANGRLQVQARLRDHDAGVTVEFQRENSLPDDDLEVWSHYVETEMTDPAG
jgi:molecular chaperone DnaK